MSSNNVARSRLRGQQQVPEGPKDVAAPQVTEVAKEHTQNEKIQELLRCDGELRRLDAVLRDQTLICSAEDCSVIWAQVKGFPWWPVRLIFFQRTTYLWCRARL